MAPTPQIFTLNPKGKPVGFGLDEVNAADTLISEVDGAAGRLTYRGHKLEDVIARFGVEGTAGLLIENDHDPRRNRVRWRQLLGQGRLKAFAAIDRLLAATRGLDLTEGLRAGLAALHVDEDMAAPVLIGAAPVLVAALIRQQDGLAPVAPDPQAGHAADYLRMIRGRSASPVEIAAMDTYLTTIAEHGLNASTFACRVVTSTASDTVSAMVAALGALKGPLHGGAPGPVLDMLDAIEAAGDAGPEAWIERAIQSGERLMGFGHRIYRVRDPRADGLKTAVKTLGAAGRIALAERLEAAALKALAKHKPGRPLETNVEFYTALLLEALGLPRQAFTATFAVGRMSGWLAHSAEQRAYGRLIRPMARYVGEAA